MIKNPYLTLVSAVFMLINLTASAQTEEEAVKQPVISLFAGMKSGDSAMVRTAFSSTAIMQTVVKNKEGKVMVRSEPVDSFVAFVGKPHKEVYDERIEFASIKIDGDLAIAWTPYKFYIDDKFSHCGVNSFQLIKQNGSWKIQYLIDTRRRQGCE